MVSRGTQEQRSWLPAVVVSFCVLVLALVAWQLSKWPPEPPKGETLTASFEEVDEPIRAVLVFGDSYAAGAGSSSGEKAWVYALAADLGWRVENLARGGTGYVSTADELGCGEAFCPAFEGMIRKAEMTEPDAVIVTGGRNDLGKSGVEDRITRTLERITTRFPQAKLIVVNPLWDDDPVPTELRDMGAKVRLATERAGGTYLDIGQPLQGNNDAVASDDVHPSDLGHRLIKDAVRKALRQADLI